jgi:hypothetical protein
MRVLGRILVSRLSHGLLASAALTAAFAATASAGPITIIDTPFDPVNSDNPTGTITTSAGAGLIAEYLDLSGPTSDPTDFNSATGEIFVTVNSFGGPTDQDQVNNVWQLIAVVTGSVPTPTLTTADLSPFSVTGTTSSDGFNSTGVTGTIAIYAVSKATHLADGGLCTASVTDTSLSLSSTCADAQLLATGTLGSTSSLDIANLEETNSTETFSLAAALDSISPDLLPEGPMNIDLTVNSGNPFLGTSTTSLNDSPAPTLNNDWCSGDGSCESTETVNWDADAVPEPGSLVLFGSALFGLRLVRRRKNKTA